MSGVCHGRWKNHLDKGVRLAFVIHAMYEHGPVLASTDTVSRVPRKPCREGVAVIILSWWLSQDLNLGLFELDPKPTLWEL